MRALDWIRESHYQLAERIDGLLADRVARNDPTAFARLREELLRHVETEERLVYPTFESHPALAQPVLRARNNLATITSLLADAQQDRKGSLDYQLDMDALREAFARHVSEDEHDGVLALAEEEFSPTELDGLADRLEEGRLPPSPAAGEPIKVSKEHAVAGSRATRPAPEAGRPRGLEDVSAQQVTDEAQEGGRWDPASGRRYGRTEFQGDQDALMPPPGSA